MSGAQGLLTGKLALVPPFQPRLPSRYRHAHRHQVRQTADRGAGTITASRGQQGAARRGRPWVTEALL